MTIKYRKSAINKGDITNHLTTQMSGTKLKNSWDMGNTYVTVGLDTSTREWDGQYFKSVGGDYMRFPAGDSKGQIKRSIHDSESVNKAIFIKTSSNIGSVDLDGGIRFDDTTVENGGTAQNNDYSDISANIFATFNANDSMRYFAGIGKSSRVPDPRELYFMSSMSPNATTLIGTPTLEQTTNKFRETVENYEERQVGEQDSIDLLKENIKKIDLLLNDRKNLVQNISDITELIPELTDYMETVNYLLENMQTIKVNNGDKFKIISLNGTQES
jgi:outer membrane cobalamin receptor